MRPIRRHKKQRVLTRDQITVVRLREQRLTPAQIADALGYTEEAVWEFLNSPRAAHAKQLLSEVRRHLSTQQVI